MKSRRIGFVSQQPKPEKEPENEPESKDSEPRWTRADIALLRRAGRSRWNVPEEIRSEAVYQLARLMCDRASDDRARVGAAKTLALLDRIDQTDERQDLWKQKIEVTLKPYEPVNPLPPEVAARALHAALSAIDEDYEKDQRPTAEGAEEGGAPCVAP